MRSRISPGAGIFVLLVGGAIIYFGLAGFESRADRRIEDRAERLKDRQDSAAIAAIIRRHAAIDGSPLLEQSAIGDAFTFQLQDSLIRADGRAIVLTATLADVYRDSVGLIAFFEDYPHRMAFRASREQVRQMSRLELEDRYLKWTVVARLESISPIVFRAKAGTAEVDEGSFGIVEVEDFEGYLLKGTLLESIPTFVY